MKTSDAIKKLQDLEKQYGDLDLLIQTVWHSVLAESVFYTTDDENNKWISIINFSSDSDD